MSSSGGDSAGTRKASLAHAPRSTLRQRSLQKGRKSDADQSISRLHVGHLTSVGLISRKSYPEVPPRVEYRLTPLGRSLARLAGLFSRWVEKNAANLLRAEQQVA